MHSRFQLGGYTIGINKTGGWCAWKPGDDPATDQPAFAGGELQQVVDAAMSRAVAEAAPGDDEASGS